jgi:hypothetical protein
MSYSTWWVMALGGDSLASQIPKRFPIIDDWRRIKLWKRHVCGGYHWHALRFLSLVVLTKPANIVPFWAIQILWLVVGVMYLRCRLPLSISFIKPLVFVSCCGLSFISAVFNEGGMKCRWGDLELEENEVVEETTLLGMDSCWHFKLLYAYYEINSHHMYL